MPLVLNGTTGVQDNSGAFVRGTSVSASGVAVDFTSIPSWVKRVTIVINSLSTSGSSIIQAQIGSGSFTTSGYLSGASGGASAVLLTTGFPILNPVFAVNGIAGIATIVNQTGNTWVYASTMATNTNAAASSSMGGGSITLGGTLDRVRITTVNGTDTFDAGSVNILYE